MSGPWEAFQPAGSGAQSQPSAAGPWTLFGKRDDDAPRSPAIDFNRPIADVRADVDKLPESQRAGALQAWARDYVKRERQSAADAGGLQDTAAGVDNIARTMANGVPILAPIGQKIESGLKSLAYHATGGSAGSPYDESQAYQNAKQEAIDRGADVRGHFPKALPYIGGDPITDSTLLKLAGGAGVSKLLKFPEIMGGSLLGAIGKGSAAATAYGTTDAALRQDTVKDGIEAAKSAVGPSALYGGGLIPVARGLGNAATALKAQTAALPAELQPYSRSAVDMLSTMAGHDDLANTAKKTSGLLGNEGMLADYGVNMRSTLEALASKTGDHMREAVQKLEGRADGAPGRITGALDDTLGPPVNVPQSARLMEKARADEAGPHYDKFYASPVKPTDELTSILHAIPDNAFASATKLMKAERIDPNNIKSNGQMIDLVKRGLDDTISTAQRAGENNQVRVYTQLKNALMAETDRILSPDNPSQSPWATGRSIYSKDSSALDALQAGRDAIKNKIHPDQLREDIANLGSQHEKDLFSLGARDQYRTIAGEAATQWGPNGDTKLRSALQSEFGRDRIGQIAAATHEQPWQRTQGLMGGASSAPIVGQKSGVQYTAQGPSSPAFANRNLVVTNGPVMKPSAAGLEARIAAETAMAKTNQNVLQNSATARRTEAQKLFPDTSKASPAPLTFEQLIMGPAKSMIDKLLAEPMNEKNIRMATDTVKMLTAQGPKSRQIINGLIAYGQQQARTPQQRAMFQNAINQALQSARISVDNGRGQPSY